MPLENSQLLITRAIDWRQARLYSPDARQLIRDLAYAAGVDVTLTPAEPYDEIGLTEPSDGQVYHDQTAPLIDYYDERGLLRRFDGTRGKTEVHDHIRATLATLRLEETL